MRTRNREVAVVGDAGWGGAADHASVPFAFSAAYGRVGERQEH